MSVTLPEGQENDRLDCEELPDWVVWREQVFGGMVEQHEAVERQWHWQVVNHSDVEIARVGTPVAVFVFAERLQNQSYYRHHWLHCAELKGRLFAKPQEPNRICAARQAAGAVPPARPNRLSSDLRHYVSLSAQILVTKTQEIVDNECYWSPKEHLEVDPTSAEEDIPSYQSRTQLK